VDPAWRVGVEQKKNSNHLNILTQVTNSNVFLHGNDLSKERNILNMLEISLATAGSPVLRKRG